MATTFIYLPPNGSGSAYWEDAVSTVGDLPAVDNTIGEVRMVLADNSLRYWDGAAWQVLIAGAAGTYVLKSGDTMSGDLTISTLTASRALTTNGAKALTSSATTDTELGYVSGVTSAIQAQINGKQATGSYITALTGGVTASGPGSAAATVASVGGKTAAAVATSVDDTIAATSVATPNTIVKRDASNDFDAGIITATLNGNVSGNLTGNVTATTVTASASGKFGASGAVTTSAALEVSSTTGAFLLPRMDNTQRNALTASAGMMIYSTTDNKVQVYENGSWNSVTGWGS